MFYCLLTAHEDCVLSQEQKEIFFIHCEILCENILKTYGILMKTQKNQNSESQ